MADAIASGWVVTPDGVVEGEVVAEAGRIVEIRPGPAPERWVCPGFCDLQVNGSDGIDVGTNPERLGELAERLVREGTTAFCPTVITRPDAERRHAVATIPATPVRDRAAQPVGIHLEGPVISPTRRGAHPAEHLRSPAAVAGERWSSHTGIAMVTLAPELPGARELIAELTSAGVVVALGHTDATAEEVQAGIDAGATHVTHLFNAMRPFAHRDPGPIGAVLADDAVTAGLICDLVHVHPVAVRMAWRSLGPDRLVLVTDAVAARRHDTTAPAIRTSQGVLAGGAITLDAAVRNLVAVTGASVPDAVRTVTATPARVLGLSDRGRLEPGARADLTVLDHELAVVAVRVGGAPAGRPARTR